jgi:hypothetical protein
VRDKNPDNAGDGECCHPENLEGKMDCNKCYHNGSRQENKKMKNTHPNYDEIKKLREQLKFIATLVFVKFSPSSYCLTNDEHRQLSSIYEETFSQPKRKKSSLKQELSLAAFFTNRYFEKMRFDPKHHLGSGDISLTLAQQEEIVDAINSAPKK